MWKALVVEDCADTRRLIARALAGLCEIIEARGVREADLRLEQHRPDLVLLDVSLPDGDGYELCSRLQGNEETAHVPIVFLTARSASQDKVVAFSLGADDYVSKPFDPLELRARVSARLAKHQAHTERKGHLRRGALRIDLDSFRAYLVVEGGEENELALTRHEFRILHTLASQPERVFTRAQLLERVWSNVAVGPRTVDAHVSNLRRKLGPQSECIESIRGVGYRFRVFDGPGC
jgi:two-component system alkaline phosphatase synthesis response regulator PhoP